MPEVTVLMAVYNGMPYLPLAIESILVQTFSDFEFLIVNDCSTDNTRDVILSYDDPRIQLLDNEENIKQTRSLNRGLEHARTELVARMDADDISHPRRLEMQVAYLRDHPEVVAVGTNLRWIDQTGKVTGLWIRPEHDLALRWMQLFVCPIAGGAVMFRKSVVWDKLGGFDPSIRFAQDWDLWSRVLPEYKLANVPDLLIDVRQHPGQDTTAQSSLIREEERRINRANPRRILGITDDSEEWLSKVDNLRATRLSDPEDRLEVIRAFFERFCTLYPTAHSNPEVLKILWKQYRRVLYETNLRSLPIAFQVFGLDWPISSKMLAVAYALALRASGGKVRDVVRVTKAVAGRLRTLLL